MIGKAGSTSILDIISDHLNDDRPVRGVRFACTPFFMNNIFCLTNRI
jgi:hypothetical protein